MGGVVAEVKGQPAGVKQFSPPCGSTEKHSGHGTWRKHFCPLSYPDSPINNFLKKERKVSALTSITFEILLDLSLLLPLRKNKEQVAEVHSSIQDHKRVMKTTTQ